MARLEMLFRELDDFDRSAIQNKMQDMAFVQSKSGARGLIHFNLLSSIPHFVCLPTRHPFLL